MSRILLIGCGKAKLRRPARADELYTGALFRSRLQYAGRSGQEYLILSSKHGLLEPDEWTESYDLFLQDLSPLDQIAWAVGVAQQLIDRIDNDALSFRALREVHCEIHAGAVYAERLRDVLIAAGFSASWPVEGLTQGEQMHYYKERQ